MIARWCVHIYIYICVRALFVQIVGRMGGFISSMDATMAKQDDVTLKIWCLGCVGEVHLK